MVWDGRESCLAVTGRASSASATPEQNAADAERLRSCQGGITDGTDVTGYGQPWSETLDKKHLRMSEKISVGQIATPFALMKNFHQIGENISAMTRMKRSLRP
jgi:hypothetical protein